jgi:hypothetical protein
MNVSPKTPYISFTSGLGSMGFTTNASTIPFSISSVVSFA